MRLLEHQAKKILSSWGIPIPRGATLSRSSQLTAAFAKRIGRFPLILKAQVYAGGRGKAGGIVKVSDLRKAKTVASELLSKRLVTAQTGPEGVPIKALLLEQGLTLHKELYIGILVDRSKGLPMVVAAREGGVAIEELAKSNPQAIQTTLFDPLLGLLPFEARRIVGWLGISSEYQEPAIQQLLALARGFFEWDASLVEVNPWALTKESGLVALDAKMTFDDNGLFRHPELAPYKAADADSLSEAKARGIGISYVGLNGSIGCMVNGAGLAMATMDVIKLQGGEPANFLDVGGGADVNQVREAFKLILADSRVRAVLVNIFGGIMKCDLIAQGIIEAAKTMKIKVPLVVRLEGTHVELGRKLLDTSGLGFMTASNMDEAARKVVKAAHGHPPR